MSMFGGSNGRSGSAAERVLDSNVCGSCRSGKGLCCTFLAESHDTLRIRTDDSNRSRWPLHPLWIDLQQRIVALHLLETKHLDGKELVLDERLMRLTISIYGYLKRMAAVSCETRT